GGRGGASRQRRGRRMGLHRGQNRSRSGAGGLLQSRTLRALAVLGTATAILAATAAPAFANAANPNPDSKGQGIVSGTISNNPDGSVNVLSGSVVVNVKGTWAWASQTGCLQRFGVGWAVDWLGVSASKILGTTGLPIKNTNLLFHVTTTLDGLEAFKNPC